MKRSRKTIILGTALAASATLLSGCLWNKKEGQEPTPAPIEEPDEEDIQEVYGPPSYWGGPEEEEDVEDDDSRENNPESGDSKEEDSTIDDDTMQMVYGPPSDYKSEPVE